MMLCKVLGSVYSTKKDKNFKGYKIMLVREITPQREFKGKPFLAIDATDSGKGDTVLVIKDGGSLQIITKSKDIPENAIIAGVVDEVSLEVGNE